MISKIALKTYRGMPVSADSSFKERENAFILVTISRIISIKNRITMIKARRIVTTKPAYFKSDTIILKKL